MLDEEPFIVGFEHDLAFGKPLGEVLVDDGFGVEAGGGFVAGRLVVGGELLRAIALAFGHPQAPHSVVRFAFPLVAGSVGESVLVGVAEVHSARRNATIVGLAPTDTAGVKRVATSPSHWCYSKDPVQRPSI